MNAVEIECQKKLDKLAIALEQHLNKDWAHESIEGFKESKRNLVGKSGHMWSAIELLKECSPQFRIKTGEFLNEMMRKLVALDDKILKQ